MAVAGARHGGDSWRVAGARYGGDSWRVAGARYGGDSCPSPLPAMAAGFWRPAAGALSSV